MSRKLSLAALLIAVLGLITPSAATAAAPAHAIATSHASTARHACTHTSSGSCIRGGQFCKQALYNHSGWDAVGRRYVCKGSHTHPHWMVP